MEYKLDDMCDWERRKAIFLMGVAEDLGINLNSYGEVAVSKNSGYVYVWSENYNFSLYMPINCELQKSDIVALWSCLECGQEEETQLREEDTLKDIEERITEISKNHYKEAHTKTETD